MTGLAIRQGSMRDIAEAYAVKVAHHRAIDERFWTLPEERDSWARDGFDPRRDVWIAVDGDAMVGFAELQPDHGVQMRVLPDRWDDGVYEALVAGLEEGARTRGVRSLTAVAPDTDAAALHVYASSDGWERSREVWRMWVKHEGEPPPVVFPDGVTVRTYTDEDAQDVHRLLDDAYLGWDDAYVAVPHDEWLAFMTLGSDYDPACWFLAESSDGLAGVCLNWATGWVKDLAVRPEWRRRGLGEALLRHSFHELWRRGVRRIGLKVDSNNGTGAPRLYERLGFVTDRRYTMFAKQL